jgi:hypothetical protein
MMPALVIVCGYIGSGKSTVAKELSKRTGIEVLSSDVVRKKLAGISPKESRYEPFNKGIYSPEFSRRTYLSMIEEARKRLRIGKSIILDATFSKLWQRRAARKAAIEENSRFLCIEVTCPEDVIRTRLGRRKASISDGRWEIFHQHKSSFERISELDKEEHLILDTSREWRKKVEKIAAILHSYL